MKSRQVKSKAKRLKKIQKRIAKYVAENTSRVEKFKSFDVNGFTNEAINKKFEVRLLYLADLKDMVFHRAEAKAALAEYLQENIDDCQLYAGKISAYKKYDYDMQEEFNSYWIYKNQYFVTLGASSCLGYFDCRFFQTGDYYYKYAAPLIYTSAFVLYVQYAEYCVLLSKHDKSGDLKIYALGYKSDSDDDIISIKIYKTEPSLKDLYLDVKKHREIQEVEF